MKRNLESRVEVVVPVEDPTLRLELREMLEAQLAPNHDAWQMQPDGTYVKRPEDDAAKGCQQALIELAEKRQRGVTRRRKRRPRGFRRRASR
jgi:polyphosphate kinase